MSGLAKPAPAASALSPWKAADVLLGRWKEGKKTSVDVTIGHPLAPSVPFHTMKDAAQASAAAEEEKHTHNDAACAPAGCLCEPFAATTFGALVRGRPAIMFALGKLLSAGAEAEEERWAVRELLGQKLEVTLKREMARMLLGSLGSPAGLPGSEEIAFKMSLAFKMWNVTVTSIGMCQANVTFVTFVTFNRKTPYVEGKVS